MRDDGRRTTEMTGRELIDWIHTNHAESMQVVIVDEGYAVFRARPEIRDNEDLKRVYVNSAGLKDNQQSIAMM